MVVEGHASMVVEGHTSTSLPGSGTAEEPPKSPQPVVEGSAFEPKEAEEAGAQGEVEQASEDSETEPLLPCSSSRDPSKAGRHQGWNTKLPMERLPEHRGFEVIDAKGFTFTSTGHMLKYDTKYVSSWAAVFRLSGTAFASWQLWLTALTYLLMAIGCAAVTLHFGGSDGLDTDRVRGLVNYLSALVVFMLGFYISTVTGRWWAMRDQTLGALWGCTDDLALLLSVNFPTDQGLKRLLLRWCMLSFELVFLQARQSSPAEEEVRLEGMLECGLLTTEERALLDGQASKSQVVWVWIAAAIRQLNVARRISDRGLWSLLAVCAKARGAIGATFAYLDTQLPYSYVHLLSVLVHLNNVAVALKCGVLWAVAVNELNTRPLPHTAQWQNLIQQLFFVIFIPVFYHAFLQLAAVLANPFGDESQGFPQLAFHKFMRDECVAFHTAAANPPQGVADAVLLAGIGPSRVPGADTEEESTTSGDGTSSDFEGYGK